MVHHNYTYVRTYVNASDLTFPIIIFEAFQDRSLGILAGGASNTITAAVTLTTAAGGLPNDFNSVRLACKQKHDCELVATMLLQRILCSLHTERIMGQLRM